MASRLRNTLSGRVHSLMQQWPTGTRYTPTRCCICRQPSRDMVDAVCPSCQNERKAS